MRSFIALACGVAAMAAPVAAHPSFEEWVVTFNKTYSSKEEYAHRASVYAANVAWIDAHNAEPGHRYRVGVNGFADMTLDEWGTIMMGPRMNRTEMELRRKPSPQPLSTMLQRVQAGENVSVPLQWDWCVQGACNAARSQGNCASSYAMVTANTLESLKFIASGGSMLPLLSPQQTLDCTTWLGNQQCNGGWIDYSYDGVLWAGYNTFEMAYPYAFGAFSCQLPKPPAMAISGYATLPGYSEPILQAAIFQQPVAVYVNAWASAFQFYTGGVMDDPSCTSDVSMSITAVGYGIDPVDGPYYRLLNSWGTWWGETGFIRIARGAAYNPDGLCGVQIWGYYPTI